MDGSLRKPGRPAGRTLGHQPGRSPCALAALKLFAPDLPGLGYGLALATARHGPGHEASPCVRHAAGPRTDSDGTSPTAITTPRTGGDCARTRLPRIFPNRTTHAIGAGDGIRVSTSDPRGARARRAQAPHRILARPRSRRQQPLSHDPISITGNVHTAHNRGITDETVNCALRSAPHKRTNSHEGPWKTNAHLLRLLVQKFSSLPSPPVWHPFTHPMIDCVRVASTSFHTA